MSLKNQKASIDSVSRDLKAARSELRLRHDETCADFDEKLQHLEQIALALNDGTLPPGAAERRMQQVIGDSRGRAQPQKAGRTQIGMRVPSTAAGAAGQTPMPPAGPKRVTPAMAIGTISRVLGGIAARVGQLVAQPLVKEARDEVRMELALLSSLRGTLTSQLEEVPENPLFVESLLEYAEDAEGVVADLIKGGNERVGRLLSFDRQWISKFILAGEALADEKASVKKAQLALKNNEATQAMQIALRVFIVLIPRVQRQGKEHDSSLVDAMLRS